MGEVKTEPVAVTLVDSIVSDAAPAGSIKFHTAHGSDDLSGFHFQCPCGCRSVGGVKVAGVGAWQWNGSRDKPTVRPSVLLGDAAGNPHWHGWLTDGVWRSC